MEEPTLVQASTTLRKDELINIDWFAQRAPEPYKGNRAAALRLLIREGMERYGIAVELVPGEEDI